MQAAPSAQSTAETAVVRFYQLRFRTSQKTTIVFPFDHELRRKISANWHITKPILQDEISTFRQPINARSSMKSSGV